MDRTIYGQYTGVRCYADSDIATLGDLAGKVVSVQVDSSAEAALEDNPELWSPS